MLTDGAYDPYIMEFTSLNTVQPHSRHIDSQCIIYGHRAIACTLNENTNRYIVFG